MEKHEIITSIQRFACDNQGRTPGQKEFEKLTGIKRSVWRGRYWPNWTAAVEEAGLQPNKAPEAYSADSLLEILAQLTLNLGHFPTQAELQMAEGIPARTTFRRALGGKDECICRLRTFCEGTEYSGVLELLPKVQEQEEDVSGNTADRGGYVYMFKSGIFYKIGKTVDPIRRLGEIKLQLPEGATPVHHFETDDPSGIEKYWHERFKDKRVGGEFFRLSSADIKAFKKRRKFM